MESKRLPRKLTAILYADVAGYSRLTGEDEDATHHTLSEYLDLISRSIESHRGHVMHYAGDAVLAMFEAVVDALGCGVRIQRDLATRNEHVPEEQKVQFRIGVNLGDVIEDRGDIYGEGVNVAARLESLADPGGICISRSVYDQVKNKLELGYESLGEQQVKNIAEAVEVYRVLLEPEAAGTVIDKKYAKRSRWLWPALVAALLLIVSGGLIWVQPWLHREEPGSIERVEFSLPDKPSIAVLPFVNLSDRVSSTLSEAQLAALPTVEVYDPDTKTWARKADLPAPRADLTVSAVNGKIYAIGGTRTVGIDALGVVEEYDPAANSWTRKANMPTPRLHLSSAVVDGKIYVFGGSPEWPVPLAAAEVYDPNTDTWSKVADMPTERTAVWAAALNSKVYVMGGLSWESEALATVEVYDPATNTWATMPDMITPRMLFAATAAAGEVYAIGGSTSDFTSLSSVEAFKP